MTDPTPLAEAATCQTQLGTPGSPSPALGWSPWSCHRSIQKMGAQSSSHSALKLPHTHSIYSQPSGRAPLHTSTHTSTLPATCIHTHCSEPIATTTELHPHAPTVGPPAHGCDRGVQGCCPKLLPAQPVDGQLVVLSHQGQQVHGGAPAPHDSLAGDGGVMEHAECTFDRHLFTCCWLRGAVGMSLVLVLGRTHAAAWAGAHVHVVRLHDCSRL